MEVVGKWTQIVRQHKVQHRVSETEEPDIIEYPDCTSTNSATIDSRMKLLAMKKLKDKRDSPVASSVLVKAHEIPRVVEEDDERIADYM